MTVSVLLQESVSTCYDNYSSLCTKARLLFSCFLHNKFQVIYNLSIGSEVYRSFWIPLTWYIYIRFCVILIYTCLVWDKAKTTAAQVLKQLIIKNLCLLILCDVRYCCTHCRERINKFNKLLSCTVIAFIIYIFSIEYLAFSTQKNIRAGKTWVSADSNIARW